MLSEGSPNVNRPACGKKFRKVNKQFLYHQDPMCLRLGFQILSIPAYVLVIDHKVVVLLALVSVSYP